MFGIGKGKTKKFITNNKNRLLRMYVSITLRLVVLHVFLAHSKRPNGVNLLHPFSKHLTRRTIYPVSSFELSFTKGSISYNYGPIN